MLRGGETLACRSSYGCPDSGAEKHKREPEVHVGPACGLPPGGAILGLRQRWGQSKVEGQQVCEGEQDWRGGWSHLLGSTPKGAQALAAVRGCLSTAPRPARAGAQRRLLGWLLQAGQGSSLQCPLSSCSQIPGHQLCALRSGLFASHNVQAGCGS